MDEKRISIGGNLDIYISWNNLSFHVADPNKNRQTKVILDNLNGCAKPGE